MPMIRRLRPVPLIVALLLAVALGATPARAAGVVTDCTETGLANAMNAGSGLITFDCGPNPVVINMTLQNGGLNVIAGRADTINGGDLVTLSGDNAQRLFDVGPNAALTLTNIILTNGYAAILGNLPDWGGAILDEGDRLALDHVTIRDSRSLHLGGAIRVVTGTVFITDSLLENNESGYGGAIDSLGALSLVNTIVRGNQAVTDSGGGLSLGGLTTIDHSQIYSNIANGADGGGGLYLTAPSVVAITATQITSNTALNPGSPGGGIQNYGALTLAGGSLSGNAASGGGGGLSNQRGATATLGTVSLSGNLTSFSSAGGAILNFGTLTLTNTSLIDNLAPASYGGGLANYSGATATVVNSTFTGNQAGLGGGIQNDAALTLLNDTFSGNMATPYWGGGLHGGPTSVITLTNVTFSGNSAALGGGAIAFDALSIDSLTLKNTLVADSLAGGNCYVVPGSARDLTSAGFNLSDDPSCAAYFTQGGDQNGQPARLFPLANNGGPTLTLLPQHNNSPVIDHGTGLGCPATDQRGLPRPTGGVCDIGAVEVQPADLAWALFLPLQRR